MLSPLEAALVALAFVAGLTGTWSPCGFSMIETIGPTGHDGGRVGRGTEHGDDDRDRHDRGARGPPGRRQPGEGGGSGGERAGGEGRARDERGAAPAVVPGRPDRLDHREAARRPRPGEAGPEGADCERGRQHLTFVSKYWTQKTRRPPRQ